MSWPTRYVRARVAVEAVTSVCCESCPGVTCGFNETTDLDMDAMVVLSWALSRAEGRLQDKEPPYRCPMHRVLTFGGCCKEVTATAGEPGRQ